MIIIHIDKWAWPNSATRYNLDCAVYCRGLIEQPDTIWIALFIVYWRGLIAQPDTIWIALFIVVA